MSGEIHWAYDRAAASRNRISKLASGLLGVATGEIVSSMTGVLGDHGGLYVAAAAIVIAAMLKLRGLPRRSPLVRYTGATLLLLSMSAAAAAAFGPAGWRLYAVLTSIGIMTLALIVFEPRSAFRLLIGASWIGFGLAATGAGVRLVVDHQFLIGGAAIAYGLMFLLTAWTMMTPGTERPLAERLTITAGIWLNLTGLEMIFHGSIPSKLLGLLVLAAGAGLWFLGRFSEVGGDYSVEETVRAMLGAVVVCLASGVVLLVLDQLILGVAGLYLGLGLAGVAAQWIQIRPLAFLRRWYLRATRDPDESPE
ncbi:hypothetical protein F4553_000167 [Allocatelliglobosispora scoriae]|uniref:Uncharacterized protein n=1 Tax=Allocatelliglobosispora scoriae TaxID=643052 RepID=A0A841BHJ1_9ACTN|nr:hypothetical protein [Allocatelliglobosispora scoriae]MBB5866788.1 hypothetical protein [Allocatelliglobosispora scoriae]